MTTPTLLPAPTDLNSLAEMAQQLVAGDDAVGAGHLTVFFTRTRGPFWSIRPARILLLAVLGTQTIATLIAVYGLFMAPLGWKWAGFVWGYAIIWALASDRVKLLAYRVLDPTTHTTTPAVRADDHDAKHRPALTKGTTTAAPPRAASRS